MADPSAPSPETPPPASAAATAKVEAAGTGSAGSQKTDAPPSNDSAKADPPKPETDPMRQLLDRMKDLQRYVAVDDRDLAATIGRLVQQGAEPERRQQPGFRHEVAYALQDLEKTPLGRQEIDPALRAEMRDRAGSAPGLENPRMLALMASTEGLQDKRLIRDIREHGNDIGRNADQKDVSTDSQIDALENRFRLSQRPADPAPSLASAERERFDRAQASEPASPGVSSGRPAQTSPNAQQAQPVTIKRGILDTILSGLRSSEPVSGAPWDPPPTSMADRISQFEKKMTDAADERTFDKAMKSGRAALDAMQGFANGEGAAVLQRVQDAAKTEPGGMSAVLSEMREGGKFADLRKQFSGALEKDLGLAAAYDKAAGALAEYGRDRSMVQDVIGRRPDPSAITARFEEMDAEVGKAAKNTPSRNDGRSMLEDLTQRAIELLEKAMAAVKAAFSRSPGPGSTPSPAPSMS